jgi:hypothetical protein
MGSGTGSSWILVFMVNKVDYILGKFPGRKINSHGDISACCPFHNDSTPSFSININEGLFLCRSASCGVRGNFAKFYKLCEGLESWDQVFRDLKEEKTSNFDIKSLFKEVLVEEKKEDINRFPDANCLDNLGDIDYIRLRRLGNDVVTNFGLKYGKAGVFDGVSIRDSIIAPVWELDGTYKTFQVRQLSGKTRWLNPLNSPIQGILYGGWRVNSSDKLLWIVEGASDVWKMSTFNARAVGLNTKSASSAQLTKLYKLCKCLDLLPIVMLDGDASSSDNGRKNYGLKLYNELCAYNLDARFVQLNYEEDPGGISYERFNEVCSQIF